MSLQSRKDSGLGTESPDGSTMALVTSPDLTNETKYSLVKDKIVKPPSPEIANVLVHTNGHHENGLDQGEEDQGSVEVNGERGSSGRAASTPASQSSPRPSSATSQLSKKEADGKPKEEDEDNLPDHSEQLSITSATDNYDEDDDDVVVTPVEDSNSRPASAKSTKSLLAAATYRPEGQARQRQRLGHQDQLQHEQLTWTDQNPLKRNLFQTPKTHTFQ